MSLFKDIFNAMAMEGFKISENQVRNALSDHPMMSPGYEGQDYDVEYYHQHGCFPYEEKLKKFDEQAEARHKRQRDSLL